MRNFICTRCEDRGHVRRWLFWIVECPKCKGDPMSLLPKTDLRFSPPPPPPYYCGREDQDPRMHRRIYATIVYKMVKR